jgi:hypothetical protein
MKTKAMALQASLTWKEGRQPAMYGISMILAPLLQTISGFFWTNGEYGVNGGTILILSALFWIPTLIILFGFLRSKYPNYASWGLLIALYGFVAGINFGFTGVLTEIFNIPHETYIKEFEKYPVATNLLLFQSGPLAPLSLIVLGIVLWRTKTIEAWVALLIVLGGISFPISRISRIEWIGHLTDLLLLIPIGYLGIRLLNTRKNLHP